MCVSTHEDHSIWGKHLISLLEITENPCYYESGRLSENTEKFRYYPLSPTESRQLLENTEKFCYYPSPPTESGRDDGKILLLPPPPHRTVSVSGDHGKDSRNSTSSTWQLCVCIRGPLKCFVTQCGVYGLG